LFVAGLAAVSNINEVLELCNIGTLFAFILVAIGIVVLRVTDPDRQRPFRTPWVPWVPLGAVATCLWLMFPLPAITWWRFFLWLAAGMILYWGAGMDESKLATTLARVKTAQAAKYVRLLLSGFVMKLLGTVVGLTAYYFGFAGDKHPAVWLKTMLGLLLAGAAFVAYVGVVIWVRGCGKYAFSKGYSHWFGLFGLLGPPGLGILFLLPVKRSGTLATVADR